MNAPPLFRLSVHVSHKAQTERSLDRHGQKIIDVVGDDPAPAEGDENKDDRADDAMSKFVQVR